MNDKLKGGLKSSTKVFCQRLAKSITHNVESMAVGGRTACYVVPCLRAWYQHMLDLGLRKWRLDA